MRMRSKANHTSKGLDKYIDVNSFVTPENMPTFLALANMSGPGRKKARLMTSQISYGKHCSAGCHVASQK